MEKAYLTAAGGFFDRREFGNGPKFILRLVQVSSELTGTGRFGNWPKNGAVRSHS